MYSSDDPVILGRLDSPGMIICYKLAQVLLLGTTFLSLVHYSCSTSRLLVSLSPEVIVFPILKTAL